MITPQIEVYDAPHLSTPCCLAEATAAYSLAHLPKTYVKQYNDAARLVDQLKARMPKVSGAPWIVCQCFLTGSVAGALR